MHQVIKQCVSHTFSGLFYTSQTSWVTLLHILELLVHVCSIRHVLYCTRWYTKLALWVVLKCSWALRIILEYLWGITFFLSFFYVFLVGFWLFCVIYFKVKARKFLKFLVASFVYLIFSSFYILSLSTNIFNPFFVSSYKETFNFVEMILCRITNW